VITEHDLQEAISECLGERSPNAQTCIKLAAFYTIRDELFGNPNQLATVAENAAAPGYSYSPPPDEAEKTIEYFSDTEFGQMVEGRKASEVWPVVDELVTEAVRNLNPRLYDAFMRKLRN